MKMPIKTQKALQAYALTFDPCSARAQCYIIAGYDLLGGESIADRIMRDHSDLGHAKRAMNLVKDAGAAEEIGGSSCAFGTFIFEDGSKG